MTAGPAMLVEIPSSLARRRIGLRTTLTRITLMGPGATAGMYAVSLFWNVPSALLAPIRAAAAVALTSSMGNPSGIASQGMVGAIKSVSGSLDLAFELTGVAMVIGDGLLLVLTPARQLHECHIHIPTSHRRVPEGIAMTSHAAEICS